MPQGRSASIYSGAFGRATVNLSDRALVKHTHRQINILIKIGGQDAVFEVDDEPLVLDETSVLLFNSWLPHSKRASESGLSMILSLFIEPDWMREALPETASCVESLFPSVRANVSTEVRMHANRLAAAISGQMELDGGGRPNELLLNLLTALVVDHARADVVRVPELRRGGGDFRIRKALEYIHQHAYQNPRMDEIARASGLSRSHFFERFRKCVGTSPQHYADYVRVTYATMRLSSSDQSLIELADELGFSGHSNFTRFFSQHIGVSPSEFRRQTANY